MHVLLSVRGHESFLLNCTLVLELERNLVLMFFGLGRKHLHLFSELIYLPGKWWSRCSQISRDSRHVFMTASPVNPQPLNPEQRTIIAMLHFPCKSYFHKRSAKRVINNLYNHELVHGMALAAPGWWVSAFQNQFS